MKDADFEYYARRAREEVQAAAEATHSIAKERHERLAQEYKVASTRFNGS